MGAGERTATGDQRRDGCVEDREDQEVLPDDHPRGDEVGERAHDDAHRDDFPACLFLSHRSLRSSGSAR